MLLVFKTVKESFGGHGFGVFGYKLVDDEVFAIGAELVELGFRLISAMGGSDSAVFAA